MRFVKILGAIVVVLIIIVLIGNSQGWFGDGGGITVNSDTVQRRDIVETVTASGKIYPVSEVQISAEISGEIVDLPVKEGDRINAGDLLIRINPDLYESQVEQAQASLDNTKAQLSSARARVIQSKLQFENAKISFERSKQLLADKVISQAEFEQAQLAFQTAQAEHDIAQESVTAMEYTVKSSEAMLKEMRNNFKRTSIYAPTGGTVVGLSKKKGEKVLGTIQMAGDVLMSIADLNNMEIRVDVSENDVLRINLGDTAEVEVDAYLNRKFTGVVMQISNSAGSNNALAAVTEQATNFKVKIYLLPESYKDLVPDEKNQKYPFYPGMSATVEIKTSTARNVLSIPIQAVTTREDTVKTDDKQFKELVYLIEEGKAKEAVIKTGLQDDNYIEVQEGLNDGQKIISGPYNTITNILKDGDMVSEESESGPAKEEAEK